MTNHKTRVSSRAPEIPPLPEVGHSKGKRLSAIFAAFLLSLFLVPFLISGENPAFLSGKVRDLSGQAVSLGRKIEAARAEFLRSGGGKLYFTACEFMSRHKVHHGNHGRLGEGYVVNPKESRIRIERKSRDKNEVGTDTELKESPSPAGLLFLHDAAKNGEIMDITVFDLDQAYDFSGAPVFWLGRVESSESLPFLEKEFDSGKDKSQLRKSLIFVIGCHPGPEAYAFLKKVAIGSYDHKIRENAIFWLGNYGDEKSLDDLKEIYRKEQDIAVKKQIIFAMQLSRRNAAVEELVRIAKQDASREARKQAVFWLGQKATAESVKALQDIVEEPDGESSLKDQAVFAISRLPKDKSVPMLIDIAKTNKSASARKKAIFWLGQSGDPAALKFFEDILLKK